MYLHNLNQTQQDCRESMFKHLQVFKILLYRLSHSDSEGLV